MNLVLLSQRFVSSRRERTVSHCNAEALVAARLPVLRLAGRAAVPHELASGAGLERDPRAVAGGGAVAALVADGASRDRILLGRRAD